jgi:broad specificity phosphatase PhoE
MILLRHAQSHFNLHFSATRQDPGIEDPELTEEGLRQAQAVAESLRDQGIARIVASPYTRTLQTAEIVAARLGLDVEVKALVREQAYFTCDIGSPRSLLEQRFSGYRFAGLEELWWSPPPESDAELLLRCAAFRKESAAAPDWRETLVVTHWAFVKGLTGERLANCQSLRFDPTAG